MSVSIDNADDNDSHLFFMFLSKLTFILLFLFLCCMLICFFHVFIHRCMFRNVYRCLC